jgi:hypothetical protein
MIALNDDNDGVTKVPEPECPADRVPSNQVPNSTECPVRQSAKGRECPMVIHCQGTQKLSQGWLHALTAPQAKFGIQFLFLKNGIGLGVFP